MVDTQLLEEEIRKSGKKKNFLAEQCRMTPQSLNNKINNLTEFTAKQILILCDELGIDSFEKRESIFFVKSRE